MSKPIWKSRFFWLGITQIGAGLIAGFLGDWKTGMAGVLSGISTIKLRFTTKDAVHVIKKEEGVAAKDT